MAFNTTRKEGILQHQKQREVLYEKRIPLGNEGCEGDIRISDTKEGLRLLVKKGSEWLGTPPLDIMTNKANTNEQVQSYISKIKDSKNDEAISIGSSSLTIYKDLLPATDDTYDIGSASAAWQDLYLEGDMYLTDAGSITTSVGDLTLNAVGEDIVFKGNGTERFRFVLDSTPELRLVGNSKIDSSGTLEIECTGAITLDETHGFTSQNTPCFSAYNSSLDQDLTADGSTYTTIDFNTEVFDVGTNYASDTFTAPVAGKYFFTTGVTVRNQDTDKWVMIQIHTSGGSYSTWGWQHNTYDDYTTHTVSCLVDLSASETAIVRGKAEAGGTDGDYDIIGGAAYTYFQGYRVA